MPRYHFNIYDGVTDIDGDGPTLTEIAEARQETLRYASELLREQSEKATLRMEWRFERRTGG